MKKIFILFTGLCLCNVLLGQNVKLVKPTVKKPSSFAIVIDNTTLAKISTEVLAYRDAVQDDGLATYLLSGDWTSPEQIRIQLKKLYKKNPKLEGIVLIGDIPVVMVRNAQHMTTAFKMDEEAFDRNESSVGSDRFYDDLHLQFEFVGRGMDPGLFYYNLKTNSPQQLCPTFYSGRIKYPVELGGDKYAAIAEFLKKAVEAKRNVQTLDNIVTFAGYGYNSDCLIAWQDESYIIDEFFPLVGKDSRSLKQLNFRMDEFMKYRLFDELQREEVDAMFFNEHGSIDKQHISGEPLPTNVNDYLEQYKWSYGWIYNYVKRESKNREESEVIDELKKKYHLTDKFFEDYHNTEKAQENDRKSEQTSAKMIISLDDLKDFNPQPRFVVFNACYNGSFHRPGSITAYYIFGNGKTVATLGNTVNVLQDKYTYECTGMLTLGCRVGEYNRTIATLEGHLIGDPTFHFNSVPDNNLRYEIATKAKGNALWRQYLKKSEATYQTIALRRLSDNGAISSEELLNMMRSSAFGTVRMECLKLLSRMRGDDFIEAIKIGLYDSYEYVRRCAASYAGKSGDQRLIPALVDVYVNYPESQRVNYAISTGLPMFSGDKLMNAVRAMSNTMTYLDNQKVVNEAEAYIDKWQQNKENSVNTIISKDAKWSQRKSAIRSVRNSNFHEYVPQFLAMIADNSDDVKLRTMMAEALGWFIYSSQRQAIIDGCNKILADPSLDQIIKNELTQTVLRLQ